MVSDDDEDIMSKTKDTTYHYYSAVTSYVIKKNTKYIPDIDTNIMDKAQWKEWKKWNKRITLSSG